MEAALYAVPLGHVRHLAETGSRQGKILNGFKNDIGKPIAAILILNTISNTGGAAVAGAAVAELAGDLWVGVFTVFFTLGILYCSEIVPKQLGVAYSRTVAEFMAVPLQLLTRIFSPLITFSQGVSRRIQRASSQPRVSAEEVLSLAALGTAEGSLDHLEGSVVRNVIRLDQVLVKDLLTPRVVVFRVDEKLTFGQVEMEIAKWKHTRVPIYNKEDPEELTGYVVQRDVYRELIKNNRDGILKEIARKLPVVPEFMRTDQLLQEMVAKRSHIYAVVDEHGALAGIVTLEDIIEELVGQEIVDEYDTVRDMRAHAQHLNPHREDET